MSDDIWAEQDCTPDAIEAAMRELLRQRHAANERLAPARVLNLVVIVDREWKGEITNRLERAGRYHGSRTILCTVTEGRTTLDATARVSYDNPEDKLGVMWEKIEIDLGPQHLPTLQTIIDPIIVSGLPTVLWSPHRHDDAIRALLPLIDVILLDSDDFPSAADAFERVFSVRDHAYVIDLAWLRTTPWRERLAASFDLRSRLAALRHVNGLDIRHRDGSSASALLLAGWLASRLGWEAGAAGAARAGPARGRSRQRRRRGQGRDARSPTRRRPGWPGSPSRACPTCRSRSSAAGAGWTRPRSWATGRSSSGRSSAPLAARAESSATASARRCCASRPTGRR